MSQRSRVLPGFGLSLGFTLAYVSFIVLIPLSAVFIKSLGIGWDGLWEILTSERILKSLQLSFSAALIASLVNVIFGILLAWCLVRYNFPGKRIVDALVDLPKPAQHQLSPDQSWLLQVQPVPRPTIAELKAASTTQLGLAGVAIDVKRRLLATEPRYASLSLQSTNALKVVHQISAPADSFLQAAQFSPDSRYMIFILDDRQNLQLQ